jgi:hypothetical protein
LGFSTLVASVNALSEIWPTATNSNEKMKMSIKNDKRNKVELLDAHLTKWVGDMPVYSIFSGLSGVFGLRIGCDKIISSSSYYKTLCVLQPRPTVCHLQATCT